MFYPNDAVNTALPTKVCMAISHAPPKLGTSDNVVHGNESCACRAPGGLPCERTLTTRQVNRFAGQAQHPPRAGQKRETT